MAFVYHDHEGFKPSKRSRKQRRQPLPVHDLVLRTTEQMTANEEWLSECRSLILDCAEPGTCYRLTCLGLGSLSELQNARIQLVFLQLVLQNVLKVAGDCVTIFDPIFTPGDVAYLKDYAGYVVLSAEPENYAVEANTVVYMPHCDLSLFETFLRDNWAPGMIPNMILVGNNLSDYADNIPSYRLSTVYPCVAKLVPHLDSRPIPKSDSFYPAFASISVQRVRDPTGLPERHTDFWSIQS